VAARRHLLHSKASWLASWPGCSARNVADMVVCTSRNGPSVRRSPRGRARRWPGGRLIRRWLAVQFGDSTAQAVRIMYGGQRIPEFAQALLALPDVDGLGASRRGRDSSRLCRDSAPGRTGGPAPLDIQVVTLGHAAGP